MSDMISAMCKVLVHDSDTDNSGRIKVFCTSNNLIAVKSNEENIMDVLKSNVDLGAIFLSEDEDKSPGGGITLGQRIHEIRPELPIILRVSDQKYGDSIVKKNKRVFCVSYTIENIDALKLTIEEHIFSKHYPNALIRGIEEITKESLMHIFDDIDLEVSVPYLVKDRIIYGELFSLIPVESNWCRGYMTLQSDEKHVIDMVRDDIISGCDSVNFRVINDVLSEITNMIWGGIKNRFVVEGDQHNIFATQVPIIVNHLHKYITFGTDTPQLCFKYTIRQNSGDLQEIALFQKFIFNLDWAPEKFSENLPTVDDLLDSGELELF